MKRAWTLMPIRKTHSSNLFNNKRLESAVSSIFLKPYNKLMDITKINALASRGIVSKLATKIKINTIKPIIIPIKVNPLLVDIAFRFR